MPNSKSFVQIVEGLLEKHKDSALPQRWAEATAFGAGSHADAFLIREIKELTNIIWLNADGIRDITATYDSNESMFNFLQLKKIITFEVRQGPDIARKLGVNAPGNLIVRVILPTTSGQLYWIAGTKKQAQELKLFMAAVLAAYVKVG